MAPRKRKAAAEEKALALAPVPARVTRSSARTASESNSVRAAVAESPAKKKRKTKAETKEAKPRKAEAANGNGASEIVDDQLEKKKTPKKTKAKTKTIVIEHCTQCRSFRRRAEEAKAILEAGDSSITVLFNPEKPRRGCFEIRAEGGEKFITLLNLKRPFKPMKDLDMEKVVKDIINKIK